MVINSLLGWPHRDQLLLILKVSIKMKAKSILKVSIRQIKAARALLAWSQEQLADGCGRISSNDQTVGSQ